MKIGLIAGGHLEIPPKGWGGVEHLIWNFSQQLTRLGHEVTIINTQNLSEIIQKVNSICFDVIHIHYDQYANIFQYLNCNKKIITSHYPYLENPEPQYLFLYDLLKECGAHNIVLSDRIKKEFLLKGFTDKETSVLPCGINVSSYVIDKENVLFPDKSIIVGKIEPRKRQAFLQDKNLNIDFVGNCVDPSFNLQDTHYLGEQSKEDIMENLTAYANMVLLSSGEAHPFVCLEALSAGLGLVLSEQSTANLDLSQPFITVIPDNKVNDVQYLKEKIEENRKISLCVREKIRKYCYDNFDWSVIIKKYLNIINSI